MGEEFINYTTLITVALNTLAGRFITIKIYENKYEEANKYFSSVFLSNCVLAVLLGFVFSIIILVFTKFADIPKNIFWDVILLFVCLFLNCIINTVFSVFKIATFATNKLYLDSMRQIEARVIKVFLIVLLFSVWIPRVYYVGIATLISELYIVIFNIYYVKKFLPDIHIKKQSFDLKYVWELICSGIWNTFNRLGQILLGGIDLLISNVWINSVSMGILSVSKLIPNAIHVVVGSLVSVFLPDFTILYAQKKNDELVSFVKQSMKIMGIFSDLPVVVLIICGESFYKLWQPSLDAKQLHILSVLACFSLIFCGGLNCIYNIFTVLNKLKWNAVSVIVIGIVNTVCIYFVLRLTNFGIYAVAGVSSLLGIIRSLLFVIPYGAICLRQKWYCFYKEVILSIVFTIVCCLIGIVVKKMIIVENWLNWSVFALIIIIESSIVAWWVMFSKKERIELYGIIKQIMQEKGLF